MSDSIRFVITQKQFKTQNFNYATYSRAGNK